MKKAEATARIRSILQSGLGRVDEEASLWLLTNIFPRHPDWEEKQGKGVSHVEVRKQPPYNSHCFFLCRVDGTEADISYKVCMNGRGTPHAQASEAARNEIFGQVSQWKRANPAPGDGMQD